jgi:hypothetical protein
MYPRWRPYPYWYDWGFYWGPSHTIIVIDLPSFYFTNWYFYFPQHHHRYPHLSSHFVNHYYGHRSSSNSVTVGVENWRSRNREIVDNDWLEAAGQQPERFREFGQFEEARQKYNRSHAENPMTQREYLDKNQRKFKSLYRDVLVEKPSAQADRSRTAPAPQREAPPTVKPPEKKEPRAKPKPESKVPNTAPQRKTEPRPIPKVDKGSEYHRNTWEKSAPKVQRKETAPAPPKANAPKPPNKKSAPATKQGTTKKGNRKLG